MKLPMLKLPYFTFPYLFILIKKIRQGANSWWWSVAACALLSACADNNKKKGCLCYRAVNLVPLNTQSVVVSSNYWRQHANTRHNPFELHHWTSGLCCLRAYMFKKYASVCYYVLAPDSATAIGLMVDWDRSQFSFERTTERKQTWWSAHYLSALILEGSSLPILAFTLSLESTFADYYCGSISSSPSILSLLHTSGSSQRK